MLKNSNIKYLLILLVAFLIASLSPKIEKLDSIPEVSSSFEENFSLKFKKSNTIQNIMNNVFKTRISSLENKINDILNEQKNYRKKLIKENLVFQKATLELIRRNKRYETIINSNFKIINSQIVDIQKESIKK